MSSRRRAKAGLVHLSPHMLRMSLDTDNVMNRVRSTYTTYSAGYHLNPVFLSSQDPPPSEVNKHFPIFHVTEDTFVPSLLPSEIEKLSNLLAQHGQEKTIPPDLREATATTEKIPDIHSAS